MYSADFHSLTPAGQRRVTACRVRVRVFERSPDPGVMRHATARLIFGDATIARFREWYKQGKPVQDFADTVSKIASRSHPDFRHLFLAPEVAVRAECSG
jgi:hypothetical protein